MSWLLWTIIKVAPIGAMIGLMAEPNTWMFWTAHVAVAWALFIQEMQEGSA